MREYDRWSDMREDASPTYRATFGGDAAHLMEINYLSLLYWEGDHAERSN
jgi:hypothetical protein